MVAGAHRLHDLGELMINIVPLLMFARRCSIHRHCTGFLDLPMRSQAMSVMRDIMLLGKLRARLSTYDAILSSHLLRLLVLRKVSNVIVDVI